MPDLVVQFDCNNAESLAEEFHHHLADRKLAPVGVRPETHGSEIWLSYPSLQPDTIKRIVSEAHPWCLDRALGLLQNTGGSEGSRATILMIADLAKVME